MPSSLNFEYPENMLLLELHNCVMIGSARAVLGVVKMGHIYLQNIVRQTEEVKTEVSVTSGWWVMVDLVAQ